MPRRAQSHLLMWLAGAGLLLYAAFIALAGRMPVCLFRTVTGYSCPGCGSQRALKAMLAGNPLDAWRFNLLLPPFLLYAAAILILPALPGRRPRRIYDCITSPGAIWTLAAVILAWWILRNIFNI